MKKFNSIIALIFFISFSICGVSYSYELPGVTTKNSKSFGLWTVGELHEDNDIEFISIETNFNNGSSFRVLLGKPDLLYYQMVSSNINNMFPHKSEEAGNIGIIIGNNQQIVPCKIRAYGPWLTNFINLPKNFTNIMAKNDFLGIQFIPNIYNQPPIPINLSGFKEALKYAETLKKNIKPNKGKIYKPF